MSFLPPVAVAFLIAHVSFIQCCVNYKACSVPCLLCRCQGCEVVLSGIEEQVSRANQHKEQQLALKQQIESEVSGLRVEWPVPLALEFPEAAPCGC